MIADLILTLILGCTREQTQTNTECKWSVKVSAFSDTSGAISDLKLKILKLNVFANTQ